MSSPARSSVSTTSGGQGGSSSSAAFADENSPRHNLQSDRISAHECKEEALISIAVLKSEVMAALQKEVKSLDEDSWMFAGPRSQIHLLSRPGSHPFKQKEAAKQCTNGGILR